MVKAVLAVTYHHLDFLKIHALLEIIGRLCSYLDVFVQMVDLQTVKDVTADFPDFPNHNLSNL